MVSATAVRARHNCVSVFLHAPQEAVFILESEWGLHGHVIAVEGEALQKVLARCVNYMVGVIAQMIDFNAVWFGVFEKRADVYAVCFLEKGVQQAFGGDCA